MWPQSSFSLPLFYIPVLTKGMPRLLARENHYMDLINNNTFINIACLVRVTKPIKLTLSDITAWLSLQTYSVGNSFKSLWGPWLQRLHHLCALIRTFEQYGITQEQGLEHTVVIVLCLTCVMLTCSLLCKSIFCPLIPVSVYGQIRIFPFGLICLIRLLWFWPPPSYAIHKPVEFWTLLNNWAT